MSKILQEASFSFWCSVIDQKREFTSCCNATKKVKLVDPYAQPKYYFSEKEKTIFPAQKEQKKREGKSLSLSQICRLLLMKETKKN